MPSLKYVGPLPRVEVSGFGHFVPGEEKVVDLMTAQNFSELACAAEGWVVTFDAAPAPVEEQSTTGTFLPEPEPLFIPSPRRRNRRSDE
jgi:hypothetical protein